MQIIRNPNDLKNSVNSVFESFSPLKSGSMSRIFTVWDPSSNKEPEFIKVTMTRQYRWNKSAIGIAFSKLFHAEETEGKIEKITGDTKTKIMPKDVRLWAEKQATSVSGTKKVNAQQIFSQQTTSNLIANERSKSQSPIDNFGSVANEIKQRNKNSSIEDHEDKEVQQEPSTNDLPKTYYVTNIPESDLQEVATFTYNKGKGLKKAENMLSEKLFGVKTQIEDRDSQQIPALPMVPSQADIEQAIAKRQKKSEQTSETQTLSSSANSEVQSLKDSQPKKIAPFKSRFELPESNFPPNIPQELRNVGERSLEFISYAQGRTDEIKKSVKSTEDLQSVMTLNTNFGTFTATFGQIKDIVTNSSENGIPLVNGNYIRFLGAAKAINAAIQNLLEGATDEDKQFFAAARNELYDAIGTFIKLTKEARDKAAANNSDTTAYDNILHDIKNGRPEISEDEQKVFQTAGNKDRETQLPGVNIVFK